MMGQENNGHSLVMEGRLVPGVAVYDRGDEIEFVIDHRMSVTFPRDQAWNAARFAFGAMAFGAGCDPLNFEPMPKFKKVQQITVGPLRSD